METLTKDFNKTKSSIEKLIANNRKRKEDTIKIEALQYLLLELSSIEEEINIIIKN